MIRSIQVSKPAGEELEAAIRWYEHQRAGLGLEFLQAVQRALDKIGENPQVGSPDIQERRVRRMLVRGFPYSIVYRLLPDAVWIIAFAHGKRRPGFWRGPT